MNEEFLEKMTEDPRKFTIIRNTGPNYVCEGWLIASVNDIEKVKNDFWNPLKKAVDEVEYISEQLNLYLTKGGNFICQKIIFDKNTKIKNKYIAKIVQDKHEIGDFFEHGVLAKALYDQAKLIFTEYVP